MQRSRTGLYTGSRSGCHSQSLARACSPSLRNGPLRSVLGRRNPELSADGAGQKVINLTMSRNGRLAPRVGQADEPRMSPTFLQEVAAVRLEVQHQVSAFHARIRSWTTFTLGSFSLEIGSSINRMASRRLALASARVLP